MGEKEKVPFWKRQEFWEEFAGRVMARFVKDFMEEGTQEDKDGKSRYQKADFWKKAGLKAGAEALRTIAEQLEKEAEEEKDERR